MASSSEYVQGLRDLGLSAGDTVLVHSALILFNWREHGGIDEFTNVVFDSLFEVLGDEGSLVVPTFSFSFTDNSPNGYWSLEESKSDMGVLTEFVRCRPDSTRTVHPFYSFAVAGAEAAELGKIHDRDSYSRNYMFGELHERNAQILILGLDYNDSMTFFHYVEQQEGVNYRFKKEFPGTINIRGKEFYDTYSMLVRDLDRGVETHVNPMGQRLEEEGTIRTAEIGGAEVKLGRAREIYDVTARNMREEPKLMYRVESG